MDKDSNEPLDYKGAGVDIAAGNRLVDIIKPIASKTRRQGVLAGLGGFGSLFELPMGRYQNPVLVSGTDGVGTKLKLAQQLDNHTSIGIDLVAMCVNDIVVQGAEPLYFLDYFATGKLDVSTAATVIEGIGKGCEIAGTALIGGETAEMPGMYHGNDYDLAGFCVGIVEKSRIIDGEHVAEGDVLIGIASSGPHSNGYSLIRKIIETRDIDVNNTRVGENMLARMLMEPTRIYVKSLTALIEQIKVKALAHITGGGITENLPRVLPNGLCAAIRLSDWQFPEIFDWIQQTGNISTEQMLTTFNCGIGMIACVAADDAAKAIAVLESQGETAFRIGGIVQATNDQPLIYL